MHLRLKLQPTIHNVFESDRSGGANQPVPSVETSHRVRRAPAGWLVLAWRLPTGPSTPRVTTWRALRRLGAAVLTPGAAILPYREHLQEQLDWIAQDIEEQGGDAYVLPVTRLSEAESHRVVEQMNLDRAQEYEGLCADAGDFLRRELDHAGPGAEPAARLKTEKELLTLQRRFRKIRDRDYFSSPGRQAAASTIDRCLRFRQGISRKLTAATDARIEVGP